MAAAATKPVSTVKDDEYYGVSGMDVMTAYNAFNKFFKDQLESGAPSRTAKAIAIHLAMVLKMHTALGYRGRKEERQIPQLWRFTFDPTNQKLSIFLTMTWKLFVLGADDLWPNYFKQGYDGIAPMLDPRKLVDAGKTLFCESEEPDQYAPWVWNSKHDDSDDVLTATYLLHYRFRPLMSVNDVIRLCLSIPARISLFFDYQVVSDPKKIKEGRLHELLEQSWPYVKPTDEDEQSYIQFFFICLKFRAFDPLKRQKKVDVRVYDIDESTRRIAVYPFKPLPIGSSSFERITYEYEFQQTPTTYSNKLRAWHWIPLQVYSVDHTQIPKSAKFVSVIIDGISDVVYQRKVACVIGAPICSEPAYENMIAQIKGTSAKIFDGKIIPEDGNKEHRYGPNFVSAKLLYAVPNPEIPLLSMIPHSILLQHNDGETERKAVLQFLPETRVQSMMVIDKLGPYTTKIALQFDKLPPPGYHCNDVKRPGVTTAAVEAYYIVQWIPDTAPMVFWQKPWNAFDDDSECPQCQDSAGGDFDDIPRTHSFVEIEKKYHKCPQCDYIYEKTPFGIK